jgi:hypothetical protein
MKTKLLLFIVGTAIITVSFVSIKRNQTTSLKANVPAAATHEPIGGFLKEDNL